MRAHPKTTYITASSQTWELIRAAYLSGLSAPAAAARFGVSVSALRKRARRQGWTKRAFLQAGTQPVCAPALAGQGEAAGAAPHWSALPPEHGAPLDTSVEHRLREHWPVPLSPGAVAREALARAWAAVREGRGREARALAMAAQEIARLDETLPLLEEEDDPAARERRQGILRDMIWDQAAAIAEAIMAGGVVADDYRARMAAFVNRYPPAPDVEGSP